MRIAIRLAGFPAGNAIPARSGGKLKWRRPGSRSAQPLGAFPSRPRIARFRGGLVLSAFLTLTLAGIPFQAAALALRAAGVRRLVPHLYHRIVCRVLGIRITVLGSPVRRGRVLFVVNHCSWADITVLSAVHPVSFVAKHEVAEWPFFGLLAKLQRTVFVERERRGAAGQHRDAVRRRLEQGDALVLFPEGTSSNGNGVLPFKTTLFAVAETPNGESDPPPIQPVSIVYTGRCGMPLLRPERPLITWYGDMDLAPHLWELVKRGPIEVSVIFHPVLSAGDGKSRKLMASAARKAVEQGVADGIAGRIGQDAQLDSNRPMAKRPSNSGALHD